MIALQAVLLAYFACGGAARLRAASGWLLSRAPPACLALASSRASPDAPAPLTGRAHAALAALHERARAALAALRRRGLCPCLDAAAPPPPPPMSAEELATAEARQDALRGEASELLRTPARAPGALRPGFAALAAADEASGRTPLLPPRSVLSDASSPAPKPSSPAAMAVQLRLRRLKLNQELRLLSC